MVKRSLEAAKAIIAGNSVNLITSINMASKYPFTGLRPVSDCSAGKRRQRRKAKRLRYATGALS
jgi:hypothetical protein